MYVNYELKISKKSGSGWWGPVGGQVGVGVGRGLDEC